MTVERLASNRTSLSLLQNSEDVTEEVEGFEELEAGKESCEMGVFGHDMAVELMNSQQLWLSAQDLNKMGPVKSPSWMGVGVHNALFSVASGW